MSHSGRSCPFPAPLASEQEDQAAEIKNRQEKISQDNRKLVDVEGVDQRDHAPPEAEVPKDIRYNQLLALLRIEPLNNEAQAEHQIADETEDGPKFRFEIEPWHCRAKKGFEKSSGAAHAISPFFFY